VPALQFKGSGFYVTDYARRSGGGTPSTTPSAPAAGDKPTKSGGTKSE
jgi:predicted nucleic acid-binding Zn ribbon protein